NQNDAVEFKIYFKGPTDDTFELIETLPNNGVYQYSHKPKTGIAGCYYVTAVDSVGNESHAGYTVCVDNCPVYILPNTFTPNNDGQNDIYHPRISRFVERIDMKIYDRWGVLVFETTHPEINWSGTDMQGKDLAEGVYYYICTYFVNGQPTIIVKQNVLNGFIHLIKGQ
ncbi:MAG TPA: gliding motility-associated C-terminal domain-containing protein, partial [Saprospiraceae bacterium]|nr:gliding motility-associated C-terminal domain-containing protein [Saprospiraceae bacterium]